MKQKAEPVVSSFKPQGKLRKFIRLIMPQLIVGIVLVCVIVAAVIIIDIHRQHEPRTGICSNSIIDQAANDLSYNRLSNLGTVVSKIQKLSNYQQDPNCMYIMTVYYINQLNIPKANDSFNQLELDNQAKLTLNPKLTSYWSISEIKQNIASLKLRNQNITNNSANLSPPTIGHKVGSK